jgi:acyl-CoA thioesterase
MTVLEVPTTEFDADTGVVAVGEGYQATIPDRWDISGRPNGGFLLAIAARAMAGQLRPSADAHWEPSPLTVTAHYLRPVEHGPAELSAEVIREGRRFQTVAGSLTQQGKERLRALATFGFVPDGVTPSLDATSLPDLPPPDECPSLLDLDPPEGMVGPPEILSRFDLRLGPGPGWPSGRRTGATEIAGWIRFADDRLPDALSLLVFADAFPPAILDVVASTWVPTLELTVHVRAHPVPGWLRARFRTRLVRDGLLEEDGELWDEDGQLVAMSRQLALLLPVG